ncbi:hypothetical protein [Streptomyces longispororuber]|uniref:hypothetical protein n=1 Tax=Streptomyces longispororuber TaxID=68230 RepID=UPI00210AF41A|nr:hypothetical protein [Streptomyces longispororuber]MCQ4206963.1 hypothetical protein [Streptomyces longispororuber]
MNPVLLHLYPANYRRAFGDEIAQSYGEATEGAGRRARFHEATDIVTHALRLRLGVSSARRGGQFCAAIAPFALAATAAYAAFNLIGTAADWYVMDTGSVGPLLTLMNVCYLLTLISAVTALAGRYLLGVLGSLAGTVGSSLAFLFPVWPMPSELPWHLAGFLATPVLIGALPLLCPPDLRPAPRVRTTAGTVSLAVWAVFLVAAVTVIDPLGIGLLLPWRLGIPTAAALLLVGRRSFARIRTTGRLAGAAAPFIASLYFSGFAQNDDVLSALGALAVTAVVLRLHRRTRSNSVNPA